MQDSKFIRLFRTLSEKEVRDFEQYLQIKHQRNHVHIAIFNYLRTHYPKFDDKNQLDIKNAYPQIFPDDKTENRKKILNALPDLLDWLEDFLVMQRVTAKSFAGKIMLAEILKERKLEKEFSKSVSEIQGFITDKNRPGVVDYQYSMIAGQLIYYQQMTDKKEDGATKLKENDHLLEMSYLVSKIKLACEMASLNNSQKAAVIKMPNLTGIFKAAIKYKADSLLLNLYIAVYEMITKETDAAFEEAESMLRKHAKQISNAEIHIILSYMRTYAAKRILKGASEFGQKSHNLNEMGLEFGLFHNGNMTPGQFTNILNIACFTKNIEWAERFLKLLPQFVEPSQVEDTRLLAKAMLSEHKNKAVGNQEKLAQVNFKDLNLNIRARALTLKSMYTQKVTLEHLLSACKTFSLFIRRIKKKVAIETYLGVQNFIRVLKMLARGKKKDKIKERINNTKGIYFSKWLLEMCDAA